MCHDQFKAFIKSFYSEINSLSVLAFAALNNKRPSVTLYLGDWGFVQQKIAISSHSSACLDTVNMDK